MLLNPKKLTRSETLLNIFIDNDDKDDLDIFINYDEKDDDN